jgi:hypothetical protein
MYSSFRLDGKSICVRGGPSLVSMLQTAVKKKTSTALVFHLKQIELIFKGAKLDLYVDTLTRTVHQYVLC